MKKSLGIINNWKQLSFLLYACFCSATTVTASEENNLAHKQVIDAAEKFVFQKLSYLNDGSLSIKAMPLDGRIQIPECPEPFSVSASPESLRQSNIAVKASCPSSNWYLYLMIKATQMQPVVVLSSTVSPGTLITKQNVEVIELDKKLIRTSTFADIETVLGARVKRRTRSGQPLVPNQLCFVCKGDSILITANINGLSIKTNGVAQQDGNVGDTIAVKNSSSRKTVRAQVISTTRVAVNI